jgi:hypothetical protein
MSDDSFFACQAFELDRWPVPSAAVLVGEAIGKIRYFLICLPDGSFGVRVERNGANEDYETDVLCPAGAFKVAVSINYSPGSPRVRVNGIDVGVSLVGAREKQFIALPAQSSDRTWRTETFDQTIPDHASDAEALLIRSVGEVNNASASHDWYVLLKSSAPLRLLLLDGLIQRANQRHKIKVTFRVAYDSDPIPINDASVWYSVAPHGRRSEHTAMIGLDAFLRKEVFQSPGSAISVRDVIRAAANADGGVHYGKPRTPEEELLLILDRGSLRMGQTASRSLLREICQVCVEALTPLVKAIQQADSGAA